VKCYRVVFHLNKLIAIVFFDYSIYKMINSVVIFLESKMQSTYNVTFFIMNIFKYNQISS